MNIDSSINLDDLRKLAKRGLPKVIYDFIEGGSDDERGQRASGSDTNGTYLSAFARECGT